MTTDKILICVTTAECNTSETDFYKSECDVHYEEDQYEVVYITDNKEHLCKVYNKYIEKALEAKYSHVVFVHGDVVINTTTDDLIRRIKKYNEMYDVFGLAGSKSVIVPSTVEPETMPLWHLMGKGNLHGCVAHGTKEKFGYTSYGPVPEQVVMIDGVFISINLAKLGKVRFDEKIPSRFHFYDLCFSLDCCLAKVKVGVGDLPIIHSSPGLRSVTPEWTKGANYFIKKYAKYAMKRLTV